MILYICEFIVALAIFIIGWVSLEFDHEGEWMDPATGERFIIAPHGAQWSATSASRSVEITRASNWPGGWSTFTQNVAAQPPKYGVMDRWAGTITWRTPDISGVSTTFDSMWKRVTAGKGMFAMSWVSVRNTLCRWTTTGTWMGRTTAGTVVALDIKPNIASLKLGSLTDLLRSTPNESGGLELLDSLGDNYTMTWDKFARGTILIHTEAIALERLG